MLWLKVYEQYPPTYMLNALGAPRGEMEKAILFEELCAWNDGIPFHS